MESGLTLKQLSSTLAVKIEFRRLLLVALVAGGFGAFRTTRLAKVE